MILASGNGISKKSPYHVISRSEESAIVGSLGVSPNKRSYISIDIEYVHLEDRYKDKKGIFFDISRMWTVEMPDKKPAKKRFEINPLYNPKSSKYIGPKL